VVENDAGAQDGGRPAEPAVVTAEIGKIACHLETGSPVVGLELMTRERLFRSLKEECVWQYNFGNFAEARTTITQWINWYNTERPHQALGYRSRRQFRALQPQLVA
jgi:integrase-like protein